MENVPDVLLPLEMHLHGVNTRILKVEKDIRTK